MAPCAPGTGEDLWILEIYFENVAYRVLIPEIKVKPFIFHPLEATLGQVLLHRPTIQVADVVHEVRGLFVLIAILTHVLVVSFCVAFVTLAPHDKPRAV